MPLLRVFTNLSKNKEVELEFLKKASKELARILGKPEGYVTVSVVSEASMLWGGEDAPCAQILLLSIGGLSQSNRNALSKSIAGLLHKCFGIAGDHYYIQFVDAAGNDVGFDGETF